MTTQKSYFPDFSQDGDTYFDIDGKEYRGASMKTYNKYKVGDEVLVRTKISRINDECTLPYVCESHNSTYYHCSEEDIYSLAPEFDYGEEIEVSDDHVNWYAEAKFISHNFDSHLPFIIKIDGKNLAYRYARKIKPTKEENILMFEGKKYKLVEE